MATIWEDVLGVTPVGVHDSFFDLGGDSLMAIQTLNRIRKVMGLRVKVADLFERRCIAGLAALALDADTRAIPSATPIRALVQGANSMGESGRRSTALRRHSTGAERKGCEVRSHPAEGWARDGEFRSNGPSRTGAASSQRPSSISHRRRSFGFLLGSRVPGRGAALAPLLKGVPCTSRSSRFSLHPPLASRQRAALYT